MTVLDRVTGATLTSANPLVVESWKDRPGRFTPVITATDAPIEEKARRGRKPAGESGEAG